jgi:hypothetical protein
MKVFILFFTGLLLTVSVFAESLTWQVLVSKPELWPRQCRMKEAIDFQNGTVQAGQTVDVDGITEQEVLLSTTDGKITFSASPEETNVLEAANTAYSTLTPKQRELTYNTIAQKKELWPQRVALTQSFDVSGVRLNKGEQLTVKTITPNTVRLLIEKINTTFDVVPQATDLMAQARVFAENSQAPGHMFLDDTNVPANANQMGKRLSVVNAGPVLNELEGKLINSVTGQSQPLDGKALPEYIVYYRGSSTCPITRQFTPDVVKFYNEMKPKHPEFEIVYMMTEDISDTSKFAKAQGFNWRAVTYNDVNGVAMPLSSAPISGLLPQLIVLDRQGRVLADGTQNAAPAALNKLIALLNTPKTASR